MVTPLPPLSSTPGACCINVRNRRTHRILGLGTYLRWIKLCRIRNRFTDCATEICIRTAKAWGFWICKRFREKLLFSKAIAENAVFVQVNMTFSAIAFENSNFSRNRLQVQNPHAFAVLTHISVAPSVNRFLILQSFMQRKSVPNPRILWILRFLTFMQQTPVHPKR